MRLSSLEKDREYGGKTLQGSFGRRACGENWLRLERLAGPEIPQPKPALSRKPSRFADWLIAIVRYMIRIRKTYGSRIVLASPV